MLGFLVAADICVHTLVSQFEKDLPGISGAFAPPLRPSPNAGKPFRMIINILLTLSLLLLLPASHAAESCEGNLTAEHRDLVERLISNFHLRQIDRATVGVRDVDR